MQAQHKDEKPVKATAKGMTVTYYYANGDSYTVSGTHPNRDNNPGNVVPGKTAKAHGMIGSDPGGGNVMAIFPSVADGWAAMKDTITKTFANYGVDDMIDRYANTSSASSRAAYKKTVHAGAGVKSDTPISSLNGAQTVVLMNVMARGAEGWKGAAYVE